MMRGVGCYGQGKWNLKLSIKFNSFILVCVYVSE